MTGFPRAAVERLRGWARRLPDDSPVRSAARASLHSARVSQGAVEELKSVWGRSGLRSGAPRYATFLKSTPLPEGDRPGQSRLLVVVLDERGGAAPELPDVDPARVDVVVASDAAAVDRALPGDGHVVFLRPGDRFHPGGAAALLEELDRDPLLDVVVFDDDVLGTLGRTDPRVRPSWSPDLLLTVNYVGRAFAVRRSVLVERGGFGATAPGSDDALWDVLLRVWPDAERAGRIPRVLTGVGGRQDAGTAAAGIVSAHLTRQGIPARAVPAGDRVRLEWQLPAWPSVRVVVPTRHNRPHLEVLRRGLSGTRYGGTLALTVVDNGERTPDAEQWYADWAREADVRVQWWTEQPFNYSAVNNAGARDGDEDLLVFLNDDVELTDPGWLTELAGWTTVPGVGLVGMQLREPDGKLQHAGVVVGIQGLADHLFSGLSPESDTCWDRPAGPATCSR